MLSIPIDTPASMMQKIKTNFKQKRLGLNLTQEALSTKSGVSLGSLKRFESSGKISLESLLQLALVLGVLEDFTSIGEVKAPHFDSMEALLKATKPKQRGGLK